MKNKQEMKLLTEILGLEGMVVYSRQQHNGIGIILQVESIKLSATCNDCGRKSSKLHENHRYLVKDLSWGEQAVFLKINRRQFKCEECKKPFSEKLSFIGGRRNYTKRLAIETIKEVLADSISGVARKGIVTAEEIEGMLKDASKEILELKPLELKRLGIDEIALIKGQGNYCAVLVDIDRGELIAILPSRKQEEIKKTLLTWGSEVLGRIEEVSIDLWKGYKSLVIELMPNAQVVADRFHVMIQINKELDQARKTEKRAVEKIIKQTKELAEKKKQEQILMGIKSSKYPLLKNEVSLSLDQKNKLAEVKAVSPTLNIMHRLKEEFREIFEKHQSWLDGLSQLGTWLSKAKKYFTDSYGTVVRWLDEIIAYFDNRTTSGVVEGINNKLKLIKRSGYGFTNFDNFKVRCLLNWYFNV